MTIYRDSIRHATDATLRGVIAFFDTPQLRKYHSGLLEDVRCELELRAEHKDDDDGQTET